MTTARIDEQQGPNQDEGPCSHASHAQARKSHEAFRARTTGPYYEWEGDLYGNCVRCSSTICVPAKGETK